MKKILCLCALLAAMLVGCSKDMDTVPEIADDNTPKPELKLIGGSNRGRKTILGEKLNNPYSLSNMSSSLTSLSSTRSEFAGASIKANALYVRFLPQNMEDVAYLENQRSLTLFDHPLDYELEVIGDYYQDPEIPEGQITWLYTTVGVDFQFPGHIRYEILEPVYIPNFINEKGQLVSQPYDSDLECLAFQRCGYGDMVPAANPTPAGLFDTPVNPVGRISIWDENKQQMVGLRYVQVTTRWGLNFSRPIRTEMAVTEFPARISAIHNIISLLRMANTSLMSMVIGGRFCLRNIICAIKPVMAIAFVCFRTLRHGIGVWSIMLRVLILKNVYLEVMQCPRSRFYASIVWKTNLTEVHLCCRKSGALIMSICLNCLIG